MFVLNSWHYFKLQCMPNRTTTPQVVEVLPCPTRSMGAGVCRRPCGALVCICIIVFFFFPSGTPLCGRTFVRNVRGVGTIRPSGSRCRTFGRDPCSVSRVASLFNFFGLGTLEANPRVSATSPGFGFLHPPSPCTYVRFGCKPGFSARRGYTHISLFLHRAPRYDPAYEQQSSPLAAAACNSMRVRLLLL